MGGEERELPPQHLLPLPAAHDFLHAGGQPELLDRKWRLRREVQLVELDDEVQGGGVGLEEGRRQAEHLLARHMMPPEILALGTPLVAVRVMVLQRREEAGETRAAG